MNGGSLGVSGHIGQGTQSAACGVGQFAAALTVEAASDALVDETTGRATDVAAQLTSAIAAAATSKLAADEAVRRGKMSQLFKSRALVVGMA